MDKACLGQSEEHMLLTFSTQLNGVNKWVSLRPDEGVAKFIEGNPIPLVWQSQTCRGFQGSNGLPVVTRSKR
jgi:hypothetical protein